MPFATMAGSRRRKSLAHTEDGDMGPPIASVVAGLQPSASTSWINPFGRASISVEDDTYHAPDSPPSSRRPSAVTIISTLLHGVGMGSNKEASSSAVRLSHDEPGAGYTSSEDAASSSGSSRPTQPPAYVQPAAAPHTRRPSAIFKAWKARRGSHSTQGAQTATPASPAAAATAAAATGFAQGRRKSSALTRVLQPAQFGAGRHGSIAHPASRIDESLHSGDSRSDTRRCSLSIVCRGERDSDELHPSQRSQALEAAGMQGDAPSGSSGITAAMAIRDTWLYGSHQWMPDGRKGSISTQATSPSYSHLAALPGRKSISGPAMRSALGLDEEAQQLHHHHDRRAGDAASVVSLSLTEEIALYTSDVQALEHNAGKARRSANSSASNSSIARGHGRVSTTESMSGRGAFVWNLPDWSANPRVPRLPELSPAPALMIADPFASVHAMGRNGPHAQPWMQDEATSSAMQRGESGSLDPHLSPVPASSPQALTPTSEQGASHGHSPHDTTPQASTDGAVQWIQPQWNSESPFRPDAPLAPAPPAKQRDRTQSCFTVEEDQSPTAPNFPPSALAPVRAGDEALRRATTYYDASPLPIVDEVPSSPGELRAPTSPTSPTSPRSPRSPRSPKSPRSFGTSETSYEMARAKRRTSYSLPRPPPGFEHVRASIAPGEADDAESEAVPTPRLVAAELTASPMSSNFAPETPSNVAATFPHSVQDLEQVRAKDDEGDDLHDQFCSVLLLDLGNGTAIPLSRSPGAEPRADPFALLAH